MTQRNSVCDARRARLLDLFCGAGGASRGYHDAGFAVVGVDINPQPNYPYEFHQADALEVLAGACSTWSAWLDDSFDTIHASPPCQAFTAYRRTGRVGDYPDLIAETRELLDATRLPWVMENVQGAPLDDSVLLCASMLDPAALIRRHRLFETNWEMQPPWQPCRHRLQAAKLYPGGRSKAKTGSSRGLVRSTMEIGSWDIPLEDQKYAMDVDWDVTLEELSEMVPPAYTEFIGQQLIQHARARVTA